MVTRYKIVYPDELNHHGVKGMKWGVRKEQSSGMSRSEKKALRKDIAGYRKKQMAAYDKKRQKVEASGVDNSKKIKALEKRAEYLYKKYNFDGDDGGGGKTAADNKAGKEYADIYFNKIPKLESQQSPRWTHNDHVRYVNNKVLKKYGEKTLNEAYDTTGYKIITAYMNTGNRGKKYKPWRIGG